MNEKVTVIGAGRMGSAPWRLHCRTRGLLRRYGIAVRQRRTHCPGWECAWRKASWRPWGKRRW
jgi:hypothetical protein